MLLAESNTCKNSKEVTVSDKGKFNSIIDCATACKAKLQNTLFAFGNAKDCKTLGCTCQCIESEKGNCAKTPDQALNLYKFRGAQMGKRLLVFIICWYATSYYIVKILLQLQLCFVFPFL